MWSWMNTGSSGIGESSPGDIVVVSAAKTWDAKDFAIPVISFRL